MKDFIYISAPEGKFLCIYINSVKAHPCFSLKWLTGKQFSITDFRFSVQNCHSEMHVRESLITELPDYHPVWLIFPHVLYLANLALSCLTKTLALPDYHPGKQLGTRPTWNTRALASAPTSTSNPFCRSSAAAEASPQSAYGYPDVRLALDFSRLRNRSHFLLFASLKHSFINLQSSTQGLPFYALTKAS